MEKEFTDSCPRRMLSPSGRSCDVVTTTPRSVDSEPGGANALDEVTERVEYESAPGRTVIHRSSRLLVSMISTRPDGRTDKGSGSSRGTPRSAQRRDVLMGFLRRPPGEAANFGVDLDAGASVILS